MIFDLEDYNVCLYCDGETNIDSLFCSNSCEQAFEDECEDDEYEFDTLDEEFAEQQDW